MKTDEEYECIKKLLAESWQMWLEMAEAGDLKVGPRFWIRYAEMKLKVEEIIEIKIEPPVT